MATDNSYSRRGGIPMDDLSDDYSYSNGTSSPYDEPFEPQPPATEPVLPATDPPPEPVSPVGALLLTGVRPDWWRQRPASPVPDETPAEDASRLDSGPVEPSLSSYEPEPLAMPLDQFNTGYSPSGQPNATTFNTGRPPRHRRDGTDAALDPALSQKRVATAIPPAWAPKNFRGRRLYKNSGGTSVYFSSKELAPIQERAIAEDAERDRLRKDILLNSVSAGCVPWVPGSPRPWVFTQHEKELLTSLLYDQALEENLQFDMDRFKVDINNNFDRLFQCVTVAVVSVKGGPGKTTTAVNLAAEGGVTILQGRAGVGDANPDRGTAADRLGIEGGMTYLQAFEDRANMTDYMETFRRFPYNKEHGVFCIRSDYDPDRQDDYSEAFNWIHTNVLLRHASLVLLDCGIAMGVPITKAAINVSDIQILVTELNHDGMTTLETALHRLESDQQISPRGRHVFVVANKYTPDKAATLQAFMSKFGERVERWFTVPFTEFLSKADPVNLAKTEIEARLAYRTIIKEIYQTLADAKEAASTAGETQTRTGSRFGEPHVFRSAS